MYNMITDDCSRCGHNSSVYVLIKQYNTYYFDIKLCGYAHTHTAIITMYIIYIVTYIYVGPLCVYTSLYYYYYVIFKWLINHDSMIYAEITPCPVVCNNFIILLYHTHLEPGRHTVVVSAVGVYHNNIIIICIINMNGRTTTLLQNTQDSDNYMYTQCAARAC